VNANGFHGGSFDSLHYYTAKLAGTGYPGLNRADTADPTIDSLLLTA
jgi:hypothetical protein